MPAFEFIFGHMLLTPRHRGCVASIGSFDGVHLGHRAILLRLIERARALALPATVIIFEPQPAEFFSPNRAPARIMRLREKVAALRALGIDRVVCLRFNASLRSMTAEDFVQSLLVQQLGIQHLQVGDDFRFGAGREGDFAFLTQAAARYGFSLANSQTLSDSNLRISSTYIRSLLAQGDLSKANSLLGAPFSLCGRVIYGRQLARHLGAPTANIAVGNRPRPLQGVYAVQVESRQERWQAVANIGVKPSVQSVNKPLLEVHLLNYPAQQSLYGERLRVSFLHKLRDEQTFANLPALQAQIAQDITAAQNYFQHFPHCD
jgi:riboflavin kinase / FMN adenylyltransferase